MWHDTVQKCTKPNWDFGLCKFRAQNKFYASKHAKTPYFGFLANSLFVALLTLDQIGTLVLTKSGHKIKFYDSQQCKNTLFWQFAEYSFWFSVNFSVRLWKLWLFQGAHSSYALLKLPTSDLERLGWCCKLHFCWDWYTLIYTTYTCITHWLPNCPILDNF